MTADRSHVRLAIPVALAFVLACGGRTGLLDGAAGGTAGQGGAASEGGSNTSGSSGASGNANHAQYTGTATHVSVGEEFACALRSGDGSIAC